MTTSYPKSVLLRENGPREGFQALAAVHPTETKLELIDALAQTGVRSIEVTSFVRADRIPQLADAEELVARLTPRTGVRYTALYLNERGLERALASTTLEVGGFFLLAASEAFLKHNQNRTLDQALAELATMAELFAERNLPFEQLMISTCFGDEYQGRIECEAVLAIVAQAFQRLNGALPAEVTFADTTGWGNPEAVRRVISEFRSRHPGVEPGLHLHDTRGTGMANVLSGLQCGVERFDASVAGLGGCPFAPGAAGNVPTENVAFLCEELGIHTGVNLEKYIHCARLAEKLVGVPLPGKLKQGGLLKVRS